MHTSISIGGKIAVSVGLDILSLRDYDIHPLVKLTIVLVD
jgi:hypothetical protein